MEDSALNRYLDEIGKEQLLTNEEERQLAERIAKGDERVHSEAIEDAIEYALGTLNERERRVVNAFFGIDQEHETMAEIAEDMELKRERVRQIRDISVRKLRKAYRNKLKSA